MITKGRSRILFLVFFTAGFAVAFFYGNFRLEKQHVLMQSEIDKSERKAELLQRRYVEQKATSDRLQRLNISLNGEKNTLQTELNRTGEGLASLENELNKVKALENEKSNKLAVCKDEYNGVIAENQELKDALEDERAIVKEHKDLIAELEVDRDNKIAELEYTIKSLEGRMESCMNKNARLCIIADELLNRYESKGIMASLLEKEPMTQIKKVELEKFAREYKENIEKQKERVRNQ